MESHLGRAAPLLSIDGEEPYDHLAGTTAWNQPLSEPHQDHQYMDTLALSEFKEKIKTMSTPELAALRGILQRKVRRYTDPDWMEEMVLIALEMATKNAHPTTSKQP